MSRKSHDDFLVLWEHHPVQTLLGNLHSSCIKKIDVNKTVLVTFEWRENAPDYYITKKNQKQTNKHLKPKTSGRYSETIQ